MQSKDYPVETPSQPHATLLIDQPAANGRLALADSRADEEAEKARSSRRLTETKVTRRAETAELVASAEFRERLLGIISHDLRNPLNTMVVAAQLLGDGDHLKEQDVWLADRIVDSGLRMARMIEQLANFTRAKLGGGFRLELVPCDLGNVCRNVIDELSSSAEILLTTTGVLEGIWDADRLAEVLSNVIGNAIHHVQAGTTVRVHAYESEAEVVVDVINLGSDIPAELHETIFSTFARVQDGDPRHGGDLGLGLYIAREISRAHGGSLEVESSSGTTMFSLRLPRSTSG